MSSSNSRGVQHFEAGVKAGAHTSNFDLYNIELTSISRSTKATRSYDQAKKSATNSPSISTASKGCGSPRKKHDSQPAAITESKRRGIAGGETAKDSFLEAMEMSSGPDDGVVRTWSR
ncbi:hypothetical protein LTR09_009867 [Extremus antarcticus]|uniref:Uncharacterized protein n=1 Tax=Extremus antarcticus TaxID=702011 RepID=A0AAJ0G5W9_9PEZI|nr:hypothetical protein LTR09_009867 [Extremus antarcticus]